MKREYTDEELMREAGEILADARLADFEKRMEEEHVFSARSMRRFRRQTSGRGSRRSTEKPAGRPAGRRWSVRGAAILAAAVFLSVAAVAVGPVIELIRTRTTAIRQENGQFVMTVERNEDADWIETGTEPTYLPEGYEEVRRNETDFVLEIGYSRPDGCRSAIEFKRFESSGGTYMYGTDEDQPKTSVVTEAVQIGPYEGIMQTVDWADENVGKGGFLYWSDGRYFYELHAIITDPPEDSALAYRPIPVPVEELLKVAESVSKDPVAAADESVLFGFVPEEDGEPVTEGLCPRCGKEALAFVSGEAVRTDPSSPDSPLYTTEEACDDPTHPDGCRVTVTYAWDEWACPNPECRYRVSGSGMHEQTRTHSGE